MFMQVFWKYTQLLSLIQLHKTSQKPLFWTETRGKILLFTFTTDILTAEVDMNWTISSTGTHAKYISCVWSALLSSERAQHARMNLYLISRTSARGPTAKRTKYEQSHNVFSSSAFMPAVPACCFCPPLLSRRVILINTAVGYFACAQLKRFHIMPIFRSLFVTCDSRGALRDFKKTKTKKLSTTLR